MADTPFRTSGYIRNTPRQMLERSQRMVQGGLTAEEAVQSAKHNPELQTPQHMLEQYPWLAGLIDEMVKARLSAYNTDEPWGTDKSYGWIQGQSRRPQSELFTVNRDSRDGHLWVEPTEAGNLLMGTDPQMYDEASQRFLADTENYLKRPYSLRPGRESDKEEGEAWWPTTDAISDAITNSQNGIGREYERPLMMALHDRFMDVMREDLAKDKPEYMNAMRKHFLPDFDYEKGKPTYEDLVRSQLEKSKNWFTDKEEFWRPNELMATAGNLFTPATSSVVLDQESYNKTHPAEIAGRAGLDALMLVGSGYLPVKGAKVAASIGDRVPGVFNAGSKAGAWAGSAAGGLLNYALERGSDAALEGITGKGSADYPITGTDAAIAATTGMLTGRPAIRHVPYGDLRLKIGGTQPDLVTRGDMFAMKNAAQRQKDLMKQGGGKVGEKGIYDYYLENSFNKYKKKYPNEYVMRGSFPPLVDEHDIPLVSDAPAGKVTEVVYDGKGNTLKRGHGKKAGYLTTRDKKATPMAREKGDEELRSWYFNDPMFEGWSEPEKKDLWKVVNKTRERGNEYSQYFTGEPVYMRGSEIAAEKRRWKGLDKYGEKTEGNKGLLRLYDDDNLQYGTRSDGRFIPETEAQRKSRTRANKTAHRRYGHDVFTESERKSYIPYQGLDRKAELGLGVTLQNATPLSSKISGVVPYIYEPYPKKETK